MSGRLINTASRMPAVITLFSLFGWLSALYFVISREIVTGMPEHDTVSKTANTESAIW